MITSFHPISGALKRKGRTDAVVVDNGVFTLGVTRPIKNVNVGVPSGTTLTPYAGPNANGLLTISSPVSYTNVDFGTTQIDIRSSDVTFTNCSFTWNKTHDLTTVSGGATDTTKANGSMQGLANMRNGSTFTNRTFTRCTFNNISQWAPTTVAAIGYGYKLDRCQITNFGDAAQVICPTSRPDTAVDVQILGSYLGDLSWWWAPTVGVVHPSTQHQHCDCIQWQGGTGLRVEGCDIPARYSTTIGTGTPNSGNDTAGPRASTGPSNQATGVSNRYSIVEGSGAYSAGQPGAFLGGSVTGLMFSTSAAGFIPNCQILNNWGGGGSNWINAGDAQLTGAFGTVSGNIIDNDQRQPGWTLNISSACSATVTNNTWSDGSGTVARKFS